MTPQEILLKAAEVISERGHCKHMLQDAEGRVCLRGALRTAAYGWAYAHSEEHCLDVEKADKLLQRQLGVSESDVPGWNDREETTAEDAILALKRASEL